MWEGLVRAPRGRVSARNLIVLLATCLVAFLAHLLFISTPVHAADAYWKDGAIVYADHTYTKQTATSSDNLGLAAGTEYYLYTEPIPGTQARKAFIIYFASGTSPPQASEAKHKTYTFSNGTFTNGSAEKTISIQPSPTTSDSGRMSETSSTCDLSGGLGWIICPVSRAIANAMDYVYGVIADFLKVQPLQVTQNGPLYKAWDIARNLANVCFIIGFLVVIYSQITGGLITNYSIRKIMPRIVVVAVLINISYWICAAMVDISNIMGYSIRDLFNSIGDSLGAANSQPSWTDVTEFLLTGGTAIGATIGGSVALLTATGGSFASLIYLLLMAMVSVIFAALVALIILAMRQALITVLIITAPLAFVLYLLPNTEKWFGKWREGFTAMMFMFPIFSVIFGASQLAGKVIIQNASSPAVAILGLVVQVAPLVVTPMIVKFSGSLLGRIAGMVNNSRKGMFDRTKNMLKDRAYYHAARARSNAADKVKDRGKAGFLRPTQLAYRHERAKQKREEWKKTFEERTAQAIHADEAFQRGRRESYNPWNEGFRSREDMDVYKRTTSQIHDETEAKHQAHWDRMRDIQDTEHRDMDVIRRDLKTAEYKDVSQRAANRIEEAQIAAKTFDGSEKQTQKLRELGYDKSFDKQMERMTNVAYEVDATATAKAMAERALKGQIVGKLREDNSQLARMAGGILDDGVRIARAQATEARSKLYMETLGAIKSDYSNSGMTLQDTYDIIYNGGLMGPDGVRKPSSDAEIHAAMDYMLNDVGNMWASLKLRRHMAHEYKIKDGDDAATRDRKRDTQQIYKSIITKSALKPVDLSGTDLGLLETGMFGNDDEFAFIENMSNGGKIKAQHMAKADIDELSHWVQIMRDVESGNSEYKLSAKGRAALTNAINGALTDPLLKKDIGDREARMMHVLRRYVSGNVNSQTENIIRPGMSPQEFTVNKPFESGQSASDDRESWDNIDDGFDPFDPSLFPVNE